MDATGAAAAGLFTFADMVHVIVIVAGMAAQAVLITWWLGRQLNKRDDAIVAEAAKRTEMQTQMKSDISRLDRDFSSFKSAVEVWLPMLPSREAMETMLAKRVGPMENDLRTLVIELARMGIDVSTRRPKQGEG